MRNLIYAINLTIDGCCDHTKFRPDEDTFEYFLHLVRAVDTFLYGRKTYQLMVPYWPDVLKNRSGETKADYEPGKDILTGGVTIPSQLAELGLIDEYRIVVHPIVVGEGRRLFEDINLQEKLQLKLVETTVFKSGSVALRYLKK